MEIKYPCIIEGIKTYRNFLRLMRILSCGKFKQDNYTHWIDNHLLDTLEGNGPLLIRSKPGRLLNAMVRTPSTEPYFVGGKQTYQFDDIVQDRTATAPQACNHNPLEPTCTCEYILDGHEPGCPMIGFYERGE